MALVVVTGLGAVAPNGEIQIDAVGFKGTDCEKATRFLEEALVRVAEFTMKNWPDRPEADSTRASTTPGLRGR